MIAVAIAALFPFLADEGRKGILLAAAIAYPVQVTAFGVLLRAYGEPARFFVWWGVGVGGQNFGGDHSRTRCPSHRVPRSGSPTVIPWLDSSSVCC